MPAKNAPGISRSKSSRSFLRLYLGILASLFLLEASVFAASLSGKIKSADGKPLEGVTVSSKQLGSTITTTVFTDEQGLYVFPPANAGSYRLWAQAIGFETARAEVSLRDSTTRAENFTLKPLPDFTRQLSSAEYMAALPEATPADARMKMAFRNNCAGCHQPSFVLQNRFDEAGWRKIIDVMERVGIYGDPPNPEEPPMPLVHYFKDELAAYLGEGKRTKLEVELQAVAAPPWRSRPGGDH